MNWTREQRDIVIVEMHKDLTIQEFARIFNVSKMQVWSDINRLRKAGIKLGKEA